MTFQEDRCTQRSAPLVYAVGGLRGDGSPLENARLAAMPARAACGENAVVPSSNPQFPTSIYTGSSVATAVVSSIAAVVWHFIPDLKARELMERIDRSGRPLSLTTDFQFATSTSSLKALPRPVTGLSLCSTLQGICQDPKYSSAPFCLELDSCQLPESHVASAGAGKPAPGSCQPWLFPQPEDPLQPKCENGCPPGG